MSYTTLEKRTLLRNAEAGDMRSMASVLEDQLFPAANFKALTASAAVERDVDILYLNHASVVIASTIADASEHTGMFVVKNSSASGTAAHTLTLTSGTFDGTNNIATLNAPNEQLAVFFGSDGNGVVVSNTGSVALST